SCAWIRPRAESHVIPVAVLALGDPLDRLGKPPLAGLVALGLGGPVDVFAAMARREGFPVLRRALAALERGDQVSGDRWRRLGLAGLARRRDFHPFLVEPGGLAQQRQQGLLRRQVLDRDQLAAVAHALRSRPVEQQRALPE